MSTLFNIVRILFYNNTFLSNFLSEKFNRFVIFIIREINRIRNKITINIQNNIV
jgi:hypothetical protein